MEDLENRFRLQLAEYASLHTRLLAQAKGSDGGLEAGMLPAPVSTETVMNEFLAWRKAYIDKVTDLDGQLPRLSLCAEDMRIGVEQAVASSSDVEGTRALLHYRFLRRADTLRCQRSMLRARARCCQGLAGGGVGRGAPELWQAAMEAAASLLGRELGAAEHRSQQMRPRSDVAAAPKVFEMRWSGAMLVLVRQQLCADRSTRGLRRFLVRLQHLAQTHRSRLWRKALELNATSGLPAQDEASDSPLCQSDLLPVGVPSRRHLEQVLEQLGADFGVVVSLNVDRGRAFAHQVAIDFPQIFEQQQRRMRFVGYPIGTSSVNSSDAPQGRDLEANLGDLGRGRTSKDACYIRASTWVKDVPWHLNVDPRILEQGVLLNSAFASSRTQVRLEHGEPSYARQLLENLVDGSARATRGWQADVDSILQAELAFLDVGDVKVVMRRLSDAAGRRSQAEDGAEPETFDEEHRPPHSLLRSYHMLRHLRCRALRRQLLGELNFFRFVQRRLLAGRDEERGSHFEAAWQRRPCTSTQMAAARGETEREEGEGSGDGDLSPRTLTRMFRACGLASLEGEGGAGTSAGATDDAWDAPVLDLETLQLDDSELVIMSEAGLKVMHAVALSDLASLEREMLSIGSYYIHKFEAVQEEAQVERMVADRADILLDLYTSEVWFNSEKRRLVETYLEIFEHTADPLERRDLARRVMDVIAVRPRLHLDGGYFTDAYAVAIGIFESRVTLMRRIVKYQIHAERALAQMASGFSAQRRNSTASDASSSASSTASDTTQQPQDEGGDRSSSLGHRHVMAEASMPPKASLAHPQEGYIYSNSIGAPHIMLTPSAEPACVDEFCSSASLVWRAELLVEAAHDNLVEQLNPPSVLLAGSLQRACYLFAIDQWQVVEEEEGRWGSRQEPHEDADLLLLILRETAIRMASGPSRKDDDEEERQPPELLKLGGLEFDGFTQHNFAELRRRCAKNASGMFAHLLGNLLHHILIRRQLFAAVIEVGCLEKVLMGQVALLGGKAEALRPEPLFDVAHEEGKKSRAGGMREIDLSEPELSGGMLEAEMKAVELGTARSLALQCTPARVQELRHLLQHELAYRNLVTMCVLHNMLLLDPAMRQKDLADMELVGPSREMASDSLVRKLRQTASLSMSGSSGRGRTAPQGQQDGQQAAKKRAEAPSVMDVSRYAHLLQTPTTHLAPVREAVATVYKARAERLRQGSLGVTEFERQMRLLWYRLLTCSSLLTMRSAADLSVRVQAARAAVDFKAIAVMLPAALSPFHCPTEERRRPLLERSGAVGSIFSIPTVPEVLRLHAVDVGGDLFALTSDLLDAFVARVASPRPPPTMSAAEHLRHPLPAGSTIGSAIGADLLRQTPQVVPGSTDMMLRQGSTAATSDLFTSTLSQAGLSGSFRALGQSARMGGGLQDTSFSAISQDDTPSPGPQSPGPQNSRQGSVVPKLEYRYGGPAFGMLQLLHELTSLLVLFYTLATVDGEPLTLLRMQCLSRDRRVELQQHHPEALDDVVGKTDSTYEALEQLQGALERLGRRLDGLDDAARTVEAVRTAVRMEVRSAFRQLVLLLRLAAHDCLKDDAADDFAVIRCWLGYLEGGFAVGSEPGAASGRGPPPLPPLRRRHLPVASLPTFGEALQQDQDDVQLQGAGSRHWQAPLPQGEGALELQPALYQDSRRYMAEVHPELHPAHPLLSPFLRALLAGHVPQHLPPSAVDWAAGAPLGGLADEASDRPTTPMPISPPAASAMATAHWQQPPPPLLPLLSALCSLDVRRRHRMSEMRLQLYERRRAFHMLRQSAEPLEAQQQEQEQSEASTDAELYGTLVLVEVLKERVASGQLNQEPPASREELAQFEDVFTEPGADPHRQQGLLASPPPSRRRHSRPVPGQQLPVGLECDADQGPTPEEVGDDMAAARQQIAGLIMALDCWLVALAGERLGHELAVLAERQGQLGAHRSAKMESAALQRLWARGGSMCAGKVDILLHALNELRTKATFVSMHHNLSEVESEERAYVLREEDLNDCVEHLLRAMDFWGDDLLASRNKATGHLIGFLRFRRDTLERAVRQPATRDSGSVAGQGAQREVRVKAEVTEQTCRMIFEIDRLHRTVRNLRTLVGELDERLSGEVWSKVRHVVTSLTSRLAAEIGSFQEKHGHQAKLVAQQMRKIREQVSAQLADISASNYTAQLRAQQTRQHHAVVSSQTGAPVGRDEAPDPGRGLPLIGDGGGGAGAHSAQGGAPEPIRPLVISDGMHRKFRAVACRDDERVLQLQASELRNRQVLLRTFHHLKVQTMRQQFEARMHDLHATLQGHKEVWERLGQASAHERKKEANYTAIAKQTSLVELRIEQLRAEANANAEQHQKLLGWKKNKARHAMHFEQKLRSYRRSGATDVASLLQALEQKSETLARLQAVRHDEDSLVEEAVSRLSRKTARLKEVLRTKQEAKQAAQRQLLATRQELEAGGLRGEDRLRLWHGRVQEVREALAKANAERQELLKLGLTTEALQESESSSEGSDD